MALVMIRMVSLWESAVMGFVRLRGVGHGIRGLSEDMDVQFGTMF